jgi:hypothetical protein
MKIFLSFFQLLRLSILPSGTTAISTTSQTTTTHGTTCQTGHQSYAPSKAAANTYKPAEDIQ